VLVDITAIPELKRVEEARDDIVLGACVTHSDIEDGRVPDVTRGALRDVARGIAYRAVRNRGTIGGSLTHADPAADWVSSLPALGASVIVAGARGKRTIAVEDYMTGALETALGEGEMLEAVRLPRLSASARWGYYKVCRKVGEFAHAIGVVLHDPDRNVCRVVLGAIERKPIVVADAAWLFGGKPSEGLAAKFDASAADRLLAEAGITDIVSRRFHITALKRAIAKAAA
jgi:aerobic carbon-monoxide dehydrogenase medium subunit